ncbi:unnamed protein product, partial [Heterotrigona itama]
HVQMSRIQDGTFSLADFLDAFSEHEVQRVLRAYENSVTVDIHCASVGDWTTNRLSKEACTRSCRVRVNPDDVLTAGLPAITSFTNYVGQYLVAQTLDQLMEPSDVVGNIRFSHPTLYVFPGGQGDAALFGINGFNMLVDGGFARKACFWDFTRHLDRLDAVLVTRINNSNVGGMSSVLRKKKEMHVYPQIGHFFCNLIERRQSNSPDGDKDIDPLILNLTDIGQEMVVNLRHISLRAHPCYRDPDPINLYHKVGHGTLDMYVLSPSKDSREVREFLAKWHTSDSKLFAGGHKKDSNNLTFPIQNLVSICALLVWQPANPEDTITRILFPGSTPQHKIFEGFERLKHLEFLKHPVCSAKSLSPSASLATLRDKPAKQKLSLISEKETSKKISTEAKKEKKESPEIKMKTTDETLAKTPIIPTKPQAVKAETKAKKVIENKKIEVEKESKKEKEAKEGKKEVAKKDAGKEKSEKTEEKLEKREEEQKTERIIPPAKEAKPKETKKKEEKQKSAKPLGKIETRPKVIEKKVKQSPVEKKDAGMIVKSSPTTPKKTINGVATKTEISKVSAMKAKTQKAAIEPAAKSTKDANNRKVVEQKNIEKSAIKDTTSVVKVSAKPKPMDRKPIGRRGKPVSPSKVKVSGSPAKSTRSTPTTSVKSDKDGVIRKAKSDKGTADSSTVSTPSGIEAEAGARLVEKSLIEQSEDISLDSIESKVLADLKEEREVVEEIEAVLQKAERIEETRKDDRSEGDDEITAELTDKKEEDITDDDIIEADMEDALKRELIDEYLIVEKEEDYIEDSTQSGEGEQKHILDEAESEKVKMLKDMEQVKEKGAEEEVEEKEKDESVEKREKQLEEKEGISKAEEEKAEPIDLSSDRREQLEEEVKEIIASAAETIQQKPEEKDDSGKKDSEDITKEPSSLSPDKLDSSEKKTTDTDLKPEADQKEQVPEKLEESQERISTLESGATTTAPTLPEDERIPLDEIKEDIDEKHIIEEVKEKDVPKVKEEVAAAASRIVPPTVTTKPDVQVFDVRQAVPCLQRDIVKTPDEVADLPVHEEVDPKLYRMEDFEKDKEEKPSLVQAREPEQQVPAQEVKEPPTPTVKEQKGVFSFFGKVADKFEKGIDKLTKKSKKDQEKDTDDKSSSKSSSPKEAKVQEKTVLEEVDVEKMFPKVGKLSEKLQEAVQPEAKTKIEDIGKKEIERDVTAELEVKDKEAKPAEEEIVEEKPKSPVSKPIEEEKIELKEEIVKPSEAPPSVDVEVEEKKEKSPEIDTKAKKEKELVEEVEEDTEEIKALLEEASKKFKTVKDSLRDSLESLEEKIADETADLVVQDVPSVKDVVKDTLEGVVEKLEAIKPHIETASSDSKEPEKVKFHIPKEEDFEDEVPTKDVKEAVRDVGEVLAGTAGIDIEDKPKDVIEIVRKVAEVLKEDDFLSDKTLFEEPTKKEETASPPKPVIEAKSPPKPVAETVSPPEAVLEAKSPEDKSAKIEDKIPVIPTKVGITEEISPYQEETEELVEVQEEPCVKVVKETAATPSLKEEEDKRDAKEICEEMLEEDIEKIVPETVAETRDDSKVDVMEAGLEEVCVKETVKLLIEKDEKTQATIEESVIGFEQKVSPGKAEIVMVSPGSTPTSPKFAADKMQESKVDLSKEIETGLKLPAEIKAIVDKVDRIVEEIIEELVIKKKKITIEIIEYITIVKGVPKERVIYIIEEIIVRKGLSKEDVVDNVDILKLEESITPKLKMELEEYIINEYVKKGKCITIEIVEEISIKKIVPKVIIIRIVQEIIVKKLIDVKTDGLFDAQLEQIDTEEKKEEEEKEKEDERKEEETEEKEIPSKLDKKEEKLSPIETIVKSESKSPVEKEISVEKETKSPKEEDLHKEKLTVEEETVCLPAEEEEEGEEEEDIEEDGFVSIRKFSKTEIQLGDKVTAPSAKPDTLKEAIDKRHEKDIGDDFEAVEQEYKVRDVTVTSLEDTSRVISPKSDESREREYAEEAVEDVTVSDVIEADEKFVHETKEKAEKKELPLDAKPDKLDKEKVEVKVTEATESIDTIEKYLDEAKEKKEQKIDEVAAKESPEEKVDITTVEKEKRKRSIDELEKDTVPEVSTKEAEKIEEKEELKPAEKKEEVKPIEKKEEEKPAEKKEEEKPIEKKEESKPVEKLAEPESPVQKEVTEEIKPVEITETKEEKREEKLEADIVDEEKKPEILEVERKKSVEEFKEEAKKDEKVSPEVDKIEVEKKVEKEEPSKEIPVAVKEEKVEEEKQEKSPEEDTSTVRRMLVTASSEDGGQETEICAAGTIAFQKIVTPDDSLKDVSVKSTPDKDSLLLDKDSLHSDISTPEKDSISDKSPSMKDVGKVTPEDSLDKSPIDRRDSRELEDSLEKTVPGKPKEADSSTSPSMIEPEVPKSPSLQEQKEILQDLVKTAGEKVEKIEPAEPFADKTEKKELDTKLVEEAVEEASEKPTSISEILETDADIRKKSLDITASKSAESLRSEDISPAETIFAKSPTDKREEQTKIPDLKDEPVKSMLELFESEKKIGMPEDLKADVTKGVTQVDSKIDVSVSEKEDKKEPPGISPKKSPEESPEKSPAKSPELKERSITEPTKAEKVESITDLKSAADRDKLEEKDKSPSPALSDKDLQEIREDVAPSVKSQDITSTDIKQTDLVVKDKSPIVDTDQIKSEPLETVTDVKSPTSEKSKSPTPIEKIEKSDVTIAVIEKKIEEELDISKRPVEESEKEVSPEKPKTPTTSPVLEKLSKVEVSEIPSEKAGLTDLVESEEPLASKRPSIPSELHEFDIKETDKARSFSITSAIEELETRDHLKSPTEKAELSTETDETREKSKSPSISGESKDLKEVEEKLDKVTSPRHVDAEAKDEAKETQKSRSASVASVTSVLTEPKDKSKSPSIAGETPDLKEVEAKDGSDKSKSPSVTSDIPDLKDVDVKETEKSRSPSVTSVPVEAKEILDKSKSPSVVGETPDLTDVEAKEIIEKSRSPSVTSIPSEGKEPSDKSKLPSIAGEESDLKDLEPKDTEKFRSPVEAKDTLDKSKTPSVVSETPDLKEVEAKDIEKSPSVTSISAEPKD